MKTKKNWKVLDGVCLILLAIGGINWGLDGLFAFDFIGWLFGYFSLLSRTLYVLIGLSSIWFLLEWKTFPFDYRKKAPKKPGKVRTARKKK
jgi:uncharacterized protein